MQATSALLLACSGPETTEVGKTTTRVQGGVEAPNATSSVALCVAKLGANGTPIAPWVNGECTTVCSATLLGSQHVLTARHCVSTYTLGTSCTDSKFLTPLPSARIFVTPNANVTQSGSFYSASAVIVPTDSAEVPVGVAIDSLCGSDLAIVRLADPVVESVTPASPIFDLGGTPPEVTVVGYGRTSPTAVGPIVRRERTIPVECAFGTGCAGALAAPEVRIAGGACFGDWGGGAYVAGTSTGLVPQIFGVMVGGVADPTDATKCGSGFYVRTDLWKDFLSNALATPLADGSIDPGWAGGSSYEVGDAGAPDGSLDDADTDAAEQADAGDLDAALDADPVADAAADADAPTDAASDGSLEVADAGNAPGVSDAGSTPPAKVAPRTNRALQKNAPEYSQTGWALLELQGGAPGSVGLGCSAAPASPASSTSAFASLFALSMLVRRALRRGEATKK